MKRLRLWLDDGERDGPANMAVDEWLLGVARTPVLRVYRWLPDWGSFGYFVKDEEAAAGLAGLRRVRRWTGGGMVDHRADWTYTLVVPRGEDLAEGRGAESYRVIHRALAGVLNRRGLEVGLAGELSPAKGGDCFSRAVEHDLIDGNKRKIAGAGQRRNRDGLLHQGSLASGGDDELGRQLAAALAEEVWAEDCEPDPRRIGELIETRYGAPGWRSRR